MNKDIYLIGEAYRNQILEASKSELRMPHIKQKVLDDIEGKKSNFVKYVVDSKIKANNNQTPYAKEFVRLYVQLKKENDSAKIFHILDRMKDIIDHIGLYIKMPQLPGRYNVSDGSQRMTGQRIPDEDKRNFDKHFSPEPWGKNMPNQPKQVKRG